MTDAERIKKLEKAASSDKPEEIRDTIREVLKGLTPEELAEMGIV